jgi:hypothetical protein
MIAAPPAPFTRMFALALVLTGCPGDEGPSPRPTTLADPATAYETTSLEPTATTGAASTGGVEPGEAVPCTAIDLLFVVDNSSTMAEEQIRLGAAAPDFVAAVGANLPDVETVHVGVVSTDDPALAVSAGRCGPFVGGLGHMTRDDDLSQALTCALQVGTGGSPDERPIEVLLAAVADLANQPGGFNSDFIRESALLVVVIVTDEEDDHEVDLAWGSAGDPVDWFAGLTAIKGGIAGDVVVLSLVGTPAPNACPPFQWDGKEGAEPAPRLAEFTRMFSSGRVGDVCAPSYDTFFFDAVPAIARACAGFIPGE